MKPRLKALELHGYKTFASRVNFEFPGNITAIVGPNGSGKSNIADALRWVLGEQSYSLLRGKKTEDMIFAGSDQRPRAGMASAAITFDNEDSWLPIDYTDVSVARRAYRDGDNEYVLNKQRVRLKDISELLAQSGLAERTYTIIGQGLVDAALSLRPEERRKFFEEAAGIGLFRSRREESINRLDSTRRNLERVQDILSELEPRLKSLERQAKRAEEYDHVKADLNVLLRDWYGFHWQDTQKELIRVREILKNQEEKVKIAREKRLAIELNVQSSRTRLGELRNVLNDWHTESADLHSNREKISRELAVLEERQRALMDQENSLKNDQNNSEERLSQQAIKLEELTEEKNRLAADLLDSQGQLKVSQDLLQKQQLDREKIENQLRVERRNLSDAETKQVQQKAHLRELTARMESQTSTVTNLTNAILGLEASSKSLEEQKTANSNIYSTAKTSFDAIQEKSVKKASELRLMEEEGKHLSQEISKVDTELSKLRAQLEVMDQAEQMLSGLTDGAKNLILAAKEGRLKGKYSAISGLLDVPAEIETAIGAVLGDQLDAILLDELQEPETALKFLEDQANGRAMLIPRYWIKGIEKIKSTKSEGIIGVASDLVKGTLEINPLISLLLGQVLIVKDRQIAQKLVNTIPVSGKIVTLKGEVFTGSGIIIAGKDKRTSLVGRPRQKKEIEQKIAESSRSRADLDELLAYKERDLSEMQKERQVLEEEVRSLKRELEKSEEDQKIFMRSYDQQFQKLDWQKNQMNLVNDDLNKTTEEIKNLELTISSGSEKIKSFDVIMRELNTKLREVPVDELQNQVVHWSTTVAVNSRALADAERRLIEYDLTVKQNSNLIESYKARLTFVASQLVEVDEKKKSYLNGETVINRSITELQIKIEPAEKELRLIENEYSKLQEDYTVAQQTESNAERNSTQAQLELSRTRESLDNLRRKIEEDFGLVALDYSEEITGPTPLPLEGIDQLTTITEIPSGLEESINRQRALLRRMGAVNPDAQREYYEVKERFEFLNGQLTDLKKADIDLRQIITELDDLMRKEFRITFNAVAAEFKQMFTRLFGGGSARLIMTDDENPTETGIDIEAKLPGRREQGLSLLSGGERSLTAVALIFSLLKVSPTPFCVMDEVDAMLDEANVGRFTELLKELSQETQFIVITHNRNTVQVADVIYGVTMGRDSASQVISLRLDEISEDMVK